MNFTFGVITAVGEQHSTEWRDRMTATFDSIRRLNIPNYEIIVVGGPFVKDGRYSYGMHKYKDIVHIPFDEDSLPYNIKRKNLIKWGILPGWVTKKTNLITKNAKYDNIVCMHDYIMFDKDWYKGYLRFNKETNGKWDIAMNKIQNFLGQRCRDWLTWRHPKYGFRENYPYNETDTKNLYISGGYWVAKKHIMVKYPLNESWLWGGFIMTPDGVDKKKLAPVDVDWSQRVIRNNKYKMNQYSICRHTRARFTGSENFVARPNQYSPTVYDFK